jgi:hypothetical protein
MIEAWLVVWLVTAGEPAGEGFGIGPMSAADCIMVREAISKTVTVKAECLPPHKSQ